MTLSRLSEFRVAGLKTRGLVARLIAARITSLFNSESCFGIEQVYIALRSVDVSFQSRCHKNGIRRL